MFGFKRKEKVADIPLTLLGPGDIVLMPKGAVFFVEPPANPADRQATPRLVQMEVKNLPIIT